MCVAAYLLEWLYYFFLPGLLLVLLLRLRKFRFLLFFSLSYSLLILTLLPLQHFRAPVSWFPALVHTEVLLLIVLLALRSKPWRRCSGEALSIRVSRGIRQGRQGLLRRLTLPAVLMALLALLLGYLAYAGPYTEIPSDAWEHLWRFQNQAKHIAAGSFVPDRFSPTHVFRQGHLWYWLQAWLCHQAGGSIAQSVGVITAVDMLVFLYAIFFFGLCLFARLRISRPMKIMMALASVLFYALHFGVNIFAYIRYYALAPTMLNFVLYLSTMAVILEFLRERAWNLKIVWMVPVFLLVMNAVHTQEALFACFMTLAVLGVEWVRLHRPGKQDGERPAPAWHGARAAKIHGLLLILVLGSVAGYGILTVAASPGISVENLFWMTVGQWKQKAEHLPFNLFYQVVTAWGLFVYVVFLARWRVLQGIPFLVAGMVIPLLTVFNPVVLDIMVRHLGHWNAVYRLNYMIPLPFVAGYVVVESASRLWKRTDRRTTIPRTRDAGCSTPIGVFRRLGNLGALIGLILLLFPIHGRYFEAPYSRIYTLRHIPAGNDVPWLADLIAWLQTVSPPKKIITDRVTGYVIRGLTPHEGQAFIYDLVTYRWWVDMTDYGKHPEVFFQRGDMAELVRRLDLKDDWLFIVNERDGMASQNGRVSGHWPEDVLNVTRDYPPQIIRYVEQHPKIFRKIWDQDRIRVYKIVGKP